MWQNGVAMYYISRVRQFGMFHAYAQLMNNAFLGTAVSWFTVVIELGFTFSVLSSRAWLRKVNILMVEGMHVGIMVFMGLVTASRGLWAVPPFAAWLALGDRRARRIASVLRAPGIRIAAEVVYRLIARHRHRIPGPWERTCAI